jgi:hypothetical protein
VGRDRQTRKSQRTRIPGHPQALGQKAVQVKANPFQKFFRLLLKLEDAKIFFNLARTREETITVEVDVPGQRWEIDCYADGEMEVEIFKSDGQIHNERILAKLIREFAD